LTWTAETTPRVVPVDDAAELRLGAHHACARLADGRVDCFGSNSEGQLGVHLPTYQETLHGGGGAISVVTKEDNWSESPSPVFGLLVSAW
jgi:hypothetical protein